ncbi:hypothetical protein MRX96_004311 [Rhipicephalus microplus]
MAMFEERRSTKILLDDTLPLSCVIESSENVQGHTCYNVRVQCGFHQETSWVVQRRYSDFDALHNQLQVSGQELPLPPKKLFNKMSREFIAERQQKLQSPYCHNVWRSSASWTQIITARTFVRQPSSMFPCCFGLRITGRW